MLVSPTSVQKHVSLSFSIRRFLKTWYVKNKQISFSKMWLLCHLVFLRARVLQNPHKKRKIFHTNCQTTENVKRKKRKKFESNLIKDIYLAVDSLNKIENHLITDTHAYVFVLYNVQRSISTWMASYKGNQLHVQGITCSSNTEKRKRLFKIKS